MAHACVLLQMNCEESLDKKHDNLCGEISMASGDTGVGNHLIPEAANKMTISGRTLGYLGSKGFDSLIKAASYTQGR